ncbi:MAG: hypothetical protein OCD02_07875 [Spirochaetaceae bacterium]
MNQCCKDAEVYLKNTNITDFVELQLFINKFNSVIEDYAQNGLSSYLLGGIELCLKLSRSIGYVQGEAKTKWLKGHVLFIGGLYRLALKSYTYANSILNKDDSDIASFYSSYALNLVCGGEVEKSLELVKWLIDNGYGNQASPIISYILQYQGEPQLSFSIIDRIKEDSNLNNFRKIKSLIELNRIEEANTLLCDRAQNSENNCFMSAYINSLDYLIKVKKGEVIDQEVLETVVSNLKRKNIFFYYIEGLLNIAEVFSELDELNKATAILNIVKYNRKDLVTLDYRLFKLLEIVKLKQEDYKGAYKYSSLATEIVKNRTTFNIDRSLRGMADFLYPTKSLVS